MSFRPGVSVIASGVRERACSVGVDISVSLRLVVVSFEVRAPARTRDLPSADPWCCDEKPISQFATHIAKLFQNSVRGDGLLSIADAVAYFEGGFESSGTSFKTSITAPPDDSRRCVR